MAMNGSAPIKLEFSNDLF